MKHVNLHTMGGVGNRLFMMAAGLAYCERYGYEPHSDETLIHKVFTVDYWPVMQAFPRKNENNANGDSEIELYGYFQCQSWLDLYTRTQCRKWFAFRPHILEKLRVMPQYLDSSNDVFYHYRGGDYLHLNYPVVSRRAYLKKSFEIGGNDPREISEETSIRHPDFTGEFSWIPDFWMLMNAPTLLRANSTFSFWAATLAKDDQVVYSPRIDGLKGGVEHTDVAFEKGNHCRPSDLSFVTDLHLAP